MVHSEDQSLPKPNPSLQLRLNSQQRELLQRAVVAEGLPSIEALVRKAISETAAAMEKSNV
jgi:uncharacterized protein (DUF1778 family)